MAQKLTQREQALRIACPLCRAGVGRRCLDQRPGYARLEIRTIHQERTDKAKARAAR